MNRERSPVAAERSRMMSRGVIAARTLTTKPRPKGQKTEVRGSLNELGVRGLAALLWLAERINALVNPAYESADEDAGHLSEIKASWHVWLHH